MNQLEAMKVFCAVVEAGGFAPAAERLGISTSAASRYVAQLESHLNARLLNRTTRRVSPTDSGYAYFERCTQLLADLDEADEAVSGAARTPRGRLRVTAPIAFATMRLAPAFAAFLREYREVTLDVNLSDSVADFIEEGLDMAIRIGRVGSDNLVARRIGGAQLYVCAAPAYRARAGTPQTPAELADHDCLTYAYTATGNQWQLHDENGETVSVRVRGSVHSNNGMLLAEMASEGAGITAAPDFILEPYLQRGELVRLFAHLEPRTLPIHVVYPTRRHLSAKVQALTGFLADWFAQPAPSTAQ